MKMEKQRARHNSTILEEAGSVIPLAESHPVSSILQDSTSKDDFTLNKRSKENHNEQIGLDV